MTGKANARCHPEAKAAAPGTNEEQVIHIASAQQTQGAAPPLPARWHSPPPSHLDALARLRDEGLHSGGVEGAGELLLLGLAALGHGHCQQLLVHAPGHGRGNVRQSGKDLGLQGLGWCSIIAALQHGHFAQPAQACCKF